MRETLRPIVCLAFVLPLLLIYELGSIFANQMSAKSGIDQWLHWFMEMAGIGHLVILPIVTTGILLHWHHKIKDQWRMHPNVLVGMLAESACLGVILFFAGNAVCRIIAAESELTTMAISDVQPINVWGTTITYIGCGVYEELVFRLMLLSGLIHAGKKYFPETELKTAAMIFTSLVFAALHYELFNPAGATIDVYEFLFRFSASIVFCLLFLFRGFGIAVGTHVIYDVMTQI